LRNRWPGLGWAVLISKAAEISNCRSMRGRQNISSHEIMFAAPPIADALLAMEHHQTICFSTMNLEYTEDFLEELGALVGTDHEVVQALRNAFQPSARVEEDQGESETCIECPIQAKDDDQGSTEILAPSFARTLFDPPPRWSQCKEESVESHEVLPSPNVTIQSPSEPVQHCVFDSETKALKSRKN